MVNEEVPSSAKSRKLSFVTKNSSQIFIEITNKNENKQCDAKLNDTFRCTLEDTQQAMKGCIAFCLKYSIFLQFCLM